MEFVTTVRNTYDFRSQVAMLRELFPPDYLIYVGAGSKASLLDVILPQRTLLIEADPVRADRIAERFHADQSVDVLNALIGEDEQAVTFFRHSIASASGTCPTASLTSIWPNVTVLEAIETTARSLDAIVQSAPAFAQAHAGSTWLAIDCFCTEEILNGATTILEQGEVIIVFAPLVALSREDPLFGSSLVSVGDALTDHNFVQAGIEQDRNQKSGRAVFTRDWRKIARVHQSKHASEVQQLEEKVRSTVAQNVGIEGTNKSLDNELRDATLQLQTVRQELATTRDVVAKAERYEQHTSTVVADAMNDMTQLATNRPKGSDMTSSPTRVLKQILDAPQTVGSKIPAMVSAISALTEQLDQLEAHSKEQLQRLVDERDELEQRCQNAELKYTDFGAKLAQLSEEHETSVNALNAELENARSHNQTATRKVEQLQSELTQARAEAEKLAARLVEVEQEADRATKKLLVAENNLEHTRRNHQVMAAKRLEAEEKLVRLGSEIDDLLSALQQAQA